MHLKRIILHILSYLCFSQLNIDWEHIAIKIQTRPIFYSRTYWIKMFGPENFSVLGFLCSFPFATWKGVCVGEKSYFKLNFHQKLLNPWKFYMVVDLILFLYKHINYIFNLSERSNKILMVHILFMDIIFAFISCYNCKFKDDQDIGIHVLWFVMYVWHSSCISFFIYVMHVYWVGWIPPTGHMLNNE